MAKPGRGISRIRPMSSVTSAGVPQPSLAIGPMRKRPSCGGNMRFRSLMMRGALATRSRGNRIDSIEPSRIPRRSWS